MDITATFPGDSEADKEITEQVHKVWAVRDTLRDGKSALADRDVEKFYLKFLQKIFYSIENCLRTRESTWFWGQKEAAAMA